jgi:hypothetical protein
MAWALQIVMSKSKKSKEEGLVGQRLPVVIIYPSYVGFVQRCLGYAARLLQYPIHLLLEQISDELLKVNFGCCSAS